MSNDDITIREHKHIQMTKAYFHHESLAPISLLKGGSGKPRFSVEPTVYIQGVGWERVDPMASGNEFLVAFRNYVRSMEFMGYEHTGRSADEITQTLENLWGEKID